MRGVGAKGCSAQQRRPANLHRRTGQGGWRGQCDGAILEAGLSRVLEEGNIDKNREAVLLYESVWTIGRSEYDSADHMVKVMQKFRVEGSQRGGFVCILYGSSAGLVVFDKVKESTNEMMFDRSSK
jgi:hypothetical protein